MPTRATAEEIARDFDEIARLSPIDAEPDDAQSWILANLPQQRGTALDVGCGVGDLARMLGGCFERVEAIDLSPGMIAEARRRTFIGNARFEVADLFPWLAGRAETYDCIVSIATLHHVDTRAALTAMARALRPGGRLLVVDLIDRSALRYAPINAFAFALARLRDRAPREFRRAYDRHGENETYLTFAEARELAQSVLPGARVTQSLFWRYRLLWDKR